jgi:ABC-type transport system involved in multi-copper enzyme maturation permease subunit
LNHRTLDVLLTTPVTSLQVVAGKLASKLLVMVLLVLTSLPLLAVLRIFGGIDWPVILALVGLTLAGATFNASLALLV